MAESFYSQFILDPNFDDVIEDLNKKTIHAIEPIYASMDKTDDYSDNSNVKVEKIDNVDKWKLNSRNGQKKQEQYKLCAYDESLVKIPSLEGNGFFISHSLITMSEDRYVPLIYLTFNFYTRSKDVSDGNNALKLTTKPFEFESKIDYINDRKNVLSKYTPDSSILFIDGPLIGGQITEYNMQLNAELFKRKIFPIYFVKNSDSSLITDNFPSLSGKYNSDFEWAFKILKPGERTGLFKYNDLVGNKKKIFSYVKAFATPPCRIEFDQMTYLNLRNSIDEIFDIIYYLLLAQGNPRNPQVRPIVIAEMYAREALKVIDFDNIIHQTGITPTMNYTRFGW